ncbi:MAG: DUF1670 domain-containing protein [Anaerolineae bacterium]|nr:DUF1670 domain-containing protein [Anaerolineae bacterium]
MPDELIVLGSGCGIPTQRRFPSAYALKVTSKLFLIDCGAPVSSLLYEYDLDPVDVRAVFLSHWHMDHVANLGLLLTQNHHQKRSRALQIYGPKGTSGKIQRLLQDSFLLRDELSYKLKTTTVKSDEKYTESLLQVTFFRTQHLEKPKYKTHFGKKAAAYGMVIDGPGWRIVYSGDIGSPQELSPYVEKCDLLIHEMAHHRPEEVAEFAAAAKVPHLLISHIGREYDESPEKIRTAFAKHYQGDLVIAEDGTRLRLGQIRKNKPIEAKVATENGHQSWDENSTVPHFNRQHTRNHSFLEVMQKDFNLPLYLSRQILAVAQELLVKHTRSMVRSGQIRMQVARLDSPSDEEKPIEVILTVDAGYEDEEVKQRERAAGLRRGRILRLLEEAIEQGGVLSQENLAHILSVDSRTIRDDLKILEAQGHQLYTLEQLAGQLPGESYKMRIIENYFDEMNKEDIAAWLHCSPQLIDRYLDKFLQVVMLSRQEVPEQEIAALTLTSRRDVDNFLALHQSILTNPVWRSRLNDSLQQNQTD